ncbi:DUF1579 family protein [Actinoplanes auranticolor]|uniref:DUF1579 domain-containing protein n=1 Tax=Actinoplanes auranticolor TaxID=47988 RepID=A0A919VU62_9ACTN|nr:DUF1579 family protein [Actinoplanes auranticolor]GIM79044.1 hypothetical protein Aau02nite_83820 [Actinoplanes auranticolor]
MSDEAMPPAPPQPAPELKQLDYLVGTWKLSGMTEEGPMGPPAKMTGTETFEWLPGGFFLVHHWEGSIDMGPRGAMPDVGYEFFDYDPETSKFRSHYFSSFGPYNEEQSHYVGDFEDDKLVLVGPARYVRALQEDGSIKYDCDFPLPDGNWVPFMHATLTKVN